jgi:hypothetical protein
MCGLGRGWNQQLRVGTISPHSAGQPVFLFALVATNLGATALGEMMAAESAQRPGGANGKTPAVYATLLYSNALERQT